MSMEKNYLVPWLDPLAADEIYIRFHLWEAIAAVSVLLYTLHPFLLSFFSFHIHHTILGVMIIKYLNDT